LSVITHRRGFSASGHWEWALPDPPTAPTPSATAPAHTSP
jgi:hypothetical protein